MGNEFQVEYRFTNMLVLQYVIFFYGCAMPMLYLFGAVAFMASFAFDKWFLFHFYMKPSTYDVSLIKQLRQLSKLVFPIHFIGGLLLLQNASIIPSKGYEGHVEGQISLKMLG